MPGRRRRATGALTSCTESHATCLCCTAVLALVSIVGLYYMQGDLGQRGPKVPQSHMTSVVLRDTIDNLTREITYPSLCSSDIDRQLPNRTAMRASGYSIPYYPVEEQNFTVVILTHDRDEILRKSLQRYGTMAHVNSIVLYWNNPGRRTPNFTEEMTFRMPLHVKEIELKSLGERYVPVQEINTSGT